MKKIIGIILGCAILCLTACNSTSNEDYVQVKKHTKIKMSDGENEIEFKLIDINFQNEVHSTSGSTYYLSDVDGESYFVAKTTIKNIGGNKIYDSDFDDIEVTFGEKYNYHLSSCYLEDDVFGFWGCDPLITKEIYLVKSVPDEVISMDYSISIKFGDTLYKYID